jgi:hypothetical protein
VRSIFGVAKWVGTELYMPTVVESEVEAQYVREVDSVYGSLASNWKTLAALCDRVIAVDLNGSRPARMTCESLSASRQSRLIRGAFGISPTSRFRPSSAFSSKNLLRRRVLDSVRVTDTANNVPSCSDHGVAKSRTPLPSVSVTQKKT